MEAALRDGTPVKPSDLQAMVQHNRDIPANPGEPIKIICAGFGKTGTMSLCVALGQLKYRTYHMAEILQDAEHSKKWAQLIEADNKGQGVSKELVKEIFEGYTACMDAPSDTYWREIAETYPDAKIILTVRDPDKWFASLLHHLQHEPSDFAVYWIRPFHAQHEMLKHLRTKWLRTYGPPGPHYMQKRIDEVASAMPADRVLIYNVTQGWKPLCSFLGVPVPDTQFPRVNDGQAIAALLQQVSRVGYTRWAVAGAVSVAGLAAGFMVFKRGLRFSS